MSSITVIDPYFKTLHLPLGGTNVNILSCKYCQSIPIVIAIEATAIIFFAKDKFFEFVRISFESIVKIIEPSLS